MKDWHKLWNYKSRYEEMSVGMKAALWYTVANFIQKGFVFLSTPILTRILNVNDYGTLILYQSWFVLFAIFATLNLSQTAYNKGLVEFENDKDNFTFSLLFLSKTITIIVAFLYFTFNILVKDSTGLTPSFMIFLFSDILFNISIEFYLARQRFEFKYRKAVLISTFSSFFIVAISTTILLAIKNDLFIKIVLDAIIRIIFGLYCFYLLFFSGRRQLKIEKKYIKYGLSYSLPLIPHFLSHYILNQSDRLMINMFDGKEKLAIYSLAYSVSMIMFLFTNAINQSIMPHTFQALKKKDYCGIHGSTKWLFVVVGGITALSILFAPELIVILGGNKYKESIWLVPPIAISVYFLFVYSMFSNISFYYKMNKLISLVSTGAALSNIILNYIFINIFGYQAAAYTTLLCYILLAFSHFFLYRFLLKKEEIHEELYNMKMILIISLILLIILFLIIVIYNLAIIRYAIIAIILFLLFTKRNKIITSLKS
ncbi:TPA: lipopolysaccharide biosynthesis protein [Streptococcus pneumoniae]